MAEIDAPMAAVYSALADAAAWKRIFAAEPAGDCHRCHEPILGTPVVDPEDPLGRQFCRDECLAAAAESSYEQHYQPGVTS